MSGVHERMQTDYIWLREHSTADDAAKTRTHGYNYLYYHAPNKRERTEMIYRSMGKQYDWDLEKFRNSKKTVDKGNKKRLIKNFFRLVKNPTGYLFWKSYRLRQARGRVIFQLMTITFLSMFWKHKIDSWRGQQKNNYLLVSGKNVEGAQTTKLGYHDSQIGQQYMPLNMAMFHELRSDWITVNPCRDQNYRKYFEKRKLYGIAPGQFYGQK